MSDITTPPEQGGPPHYEPKDGSDLPPEDQELPEADQTPELDGDVLEVDLAGEEED